MVTSVPNEHVVAKMTVAINHAKHCKQLDLIATTEDSGFGYSDESTTPGFGN